MEEVIEDRYPKYFKCISHHSDKGMIVKFTGLETGELVKEAPEGMLKIPTIGKWTKHTDKIAWKQVDFEGVPEDVTSDDLVGLTTRKREECQFTKYGFEKPDFDCEIYERDRTYLIGKVRTASNIKPISWDWQTGICREDEEFHLKPINKPWYKDESNFPCIAFNSEFNLLEILQEKGEYSTEYYSGLRLATKEEVLSLYKEEK